ncbi:hypothetical protein SOCE26_000670 [Sorangium cellulosum]|uniref:Uncharacterized protein n=1 Tax=Sorangium cellulosum TaxID=56 RepID=A0A2L0EHD0_SORCE|nr:hypothetical protein SOCE26_000670 [Sorangium cellulosum]
MITQHESSGADVHRPMTPVSIAPVAASVPPAAAGDLDLELELLAQGVRQKRRNRILAMTGLLGVGLLAATVFVSAGKIKEAEAAQAEAVAARIVEQDRIAQLNLQIEARDKKVTELTAALEAAKSDAEKAAKAIAAYKAAEEARAKEEEAEGEETPAAGAKTAKAAPKAAAVRRGRAAQGRGASSALPGTRGKKGGKCVCKQGDPLCGCL